MATFNVCPHKGLFSATGVRRTPNKRPALALAGKTAEAMRTATGQWGALSRCETELESRGGTVAGRKTRGGVENRDKSVGALRRCETEPQTRGSAGGGGQRVQCDEGTPRVADPSKQETIQAMEAATTG